MILPMLLKSCKDKDLKKYEGTYIAQEKFDGTRIIVEKRGKTVSMQTRSGKNNLSTEYPEITKELSTIIGDIILDCELVFLDKDGKVEFLTGLAKESRTDLTPMLMVFDILEWNNESIRTKDMEYRISSIQNIVCSHQFKYIRYVSSFKDNFDKLYKDVIARGGEGIVLKKINSIYKDGKRSSDWLKIKKEDTADCFIVGMMEGEGKYADTFGSLILAQYNKASTVKVICNCSGFTDQQRTDFFNMLIKEPWVETFPSTKGELTHIIHKVAPKVVVEIEFMERLESGSVRHPRFIRIRTDKKPKDCVYND